MSRPSSKPREESWKMSNSNTSSRKALPKMNIKKTTPTTTKAICRIKLSLRLAMTIHTSSTVRLSLKSTKWSRRTRRMILQKLWLIRCGKKSWDRIPNCSSTAKSTKSTWCKRTPKTSFTEQCAKTCSSGTSLNSRKATTNRPPKSHESHYPKKRASPS